MRFISASMKLSISCGDFCACIVETLMKAALNIRPVLFNIFFMLRIFLMC